MSAHDAGLVDTHAHLDAQEFAGDCDEVVRRAAAAGLVAVVTVGVDLESSRAAIRLAERYPMVVAAVGIHPHNAAGGNETTLRELRVLACHARVVAVGEIGLDYYRNRVAPDVQRRVFAAQLTMAAEVGLPVIVHDREAHEDVMQFLSRQTSVGPLSGVLHCFSGDVAMARVIERLGFFLSVAGPVTYPKSERLTEVVRAVPTSQILVETDCPFLTPQQWRGKRNEPAFVRTTLERVATLRGQPAAQVAAETTANAARLFGRRL
ncbi:MAG: TatD family hydrolase, partial [Phycisphaerales bacterium]|nr:TatD family hydrolase [Phycisphaerales bacterium]